MNLKKHQREFASRIFNLVLLCSLLLAASFIGWYVRDVLAGGSVYVEMDEAKVTTLYVTSIDELTSGGKVKVYNMTVQNGTDFPASPASGQLFFREDEHKVYVYNSTDWVDLTVGGVSDHGALTGLSDDDHDIYILKSGTRALTGDWDVGNHAITGVTWLNATDIMFTDELWLGTQNVTDVLAYPEQLASYIVFKDDSTYYAKNCSDGTIPYSGVNFITDVMNNILGNDRTIIVKAGTYIQNADLLLNELEYCDIIHQAGVRISLSGATTKALHMKGCRFCAVELGRIYSPSGHTNPVILFEDTSTYKAESNKVGYRYIVGSTGNTDTHLHVNSSTSKGIVYNWFGKGRSYKCGTGVKVETVGSGWINGNFFVDIQISEAVVGLEMVKGGGDISTNIFEDVKHQATTVTTHGFKNIDGERNAFISCKAWDFTGSQISMNIKSTATDTLILGGIITVLNFEDLGTRTVILDEWTRQIPFENSRFQNAVTFSGISNGTYVAHGLGGTPQIVVVTLTVQGYAWVGTKNSTHVQIYANVATVSGSMYCEYKP